MVGGWIEAEHGNNDIINWCEMTVDGWTEARKESQTTHISTHTQYNLLSKRSENNQ